MIRVVRTIGPKPVSSSRTMTLATKAVLTNMKKIDQMMLIWAMAKGEFLWTKLESPMWIWSEVVAPKVSRKKTTAATQNTGWRSW